MYIHTTQAQIQKQTVCTICVSDFTEPYDKAKHLDVHVMCITQYGTPQFSCSRII